MINKYLSLILVVLLSVNFGFSQGVCGTYKGSFEKDKQKHPEFYQSLEIINADLEKQHKAALNKMTNLKSENGKKIIPVVVHVIHDMGGENISDASIQGALDILNANINGQAANFLSKTPDIFAAVRGDLNVEFRLAKLDPDGNPTTGINRVRSSLTNEPSPSNLVKGLSYWNSYQYFNIWTVKKFLAQDDGNTLLGYAQFPWSGSMSTDGVVLLSSQMVNGGTLTHETGHWLGLCHTWACGGGECGDDGVIDTPPARSPNWGVDISDFPYHVGLANFGCVADSINPAGEMFVNFMDYSDDADVTMFTKGQGVVMNEVLDGQYDEVTGTSGIGFREYLWSVDNILATGVADGFLTPICAQKADFTITTGISSMCEGEDIIIKGNQSQFGNGNVTEMSWDFGDNTFSANDNANFLTHTYATEGLFDISFTVVYNETTEARAASLLDLDLSNASSYDSIIRALIVQGTQSELITMGATNITLYLDLDGYSINSYWANGVYYPDTLFYRGELAQTTYVAYYENTCTSTIVKENFIDVNPTSSSNTDGSYTYSFENAADLSGDWDITSDVTDGDWSFNTTQNSSWEWVDDVAISGKASIMINKDGLTLGSASDELVSKAYDLSALSNPAIKFSWSGAAVNTFPVNELKVYYSDDCGEVWRALGTLTPVEVANAGLYTTNFKPQVSEWRDTIMTKAQLKNDNIRFKFEYFTNGSANNFYIDNIKIGEASALFSPAVNASKLSIYPNPTNGYAVITLENLADMNVEVKLVNILGAEARNLFEGKIASNYYVLDKVDLSTLEAGIYFVKVVANGNIVRIDKLIFSK